MVIVVIVIYYCINFGSHKTEGTGKMRICGCADLRIGVMKMIILEYDYMLVCLITSTALTLTLTDPHDAIITIITLLHTGVSLPNPQIRTSANPHFTRDLVTVVLEASVRSDAISTMLFAEHQTMPSAATGNLTV